jgi:RNA polymerase sigma factor (sigma-70 family)
VDKFMKETEDRDLERLFAEARRYPLLTAEEERDIDQRKWSAVYEIQDAMVADDAAREWLAAWAEHCGSVTPDIHRFRNRDNHFVLRRELVDYLDGGSKHDKAAAFRSSVKRMRSFAKRQQAVNELELPASLVVGLATWLLRKSGSDISDTVADGLEDWESQWPDKPRRNDFRPGLLRDMKRAHLNYTEARDTLVMHNLRLVYSIAGKHKGKGIAYLDLIQEGTLGLLRAAEKYESRKGFRFSTYCFNWITQSIRRYVGDSGGLIRYPTHVQEQVAKLYRHKHMEQARSGAEPTEAELADSAGISLEKTRNLLQLRNLGISLDAPQYEDDDGSMIDTIPDEVAGERTVMIITDSAFLYTAGNFDHKTKAMEYLNEVIDMGYPDAGMLEEDELERLIASLSKEGISVTASFTIQIMALKKPVEVSFFKPLEDVLMYAGQDGFHRYVYGEYDKLSKAMERLPEIKDMGYNDAFIMSVLRYQRLAGER